jgi:hypothetical protein
MIAGCTAGAVTTLEKFVRGMYHNEHLKGQDALGGFVGSCLSSAVGGLIRDSLGPGIGPALSAAIQGQIIGGIAKMGIQVLGDYAPPYGPP